MAVQQDNHVCKECIPRSMRRKESLTVEHHWGSFCMLHDGVIVIFDVIGCASEAGTVCAGATACMVA